MGLLDTLSTVRIHYILRSNIPKITVSDTELDPEVPDNLTFTAFPYLLQDNEKTHEKLQS
jgi:hypothetical protein